MDCGPQCLSVICSLYGYDPDFEEIRNYCGASKSGVSMYNIKRAAERIGFNARVLKTTFDALNGELLLP